METSPKMDWGGQKGELSDSTTGVKDRKHCQLQTPTRVVNRKESFIMGPNR